MIYTRMSISCGFHFYANQKECKNRKESADMVMIFRWISEYMITIVKEKVLQSVRICGAKNTDLIE